MDGYSNLFLVVGIAVSLFLVVQHTGVCGDQLRTTANVPSSNVTVVNGLPLLLIATSFFWQRTSRRSTVCHKAN